MSYRTLVGLLALPLLVLAISCESSTRADESKSDSSVSMAPPKPNARMQQILDAHASLNPKPIETLSPEEARKQPSPADAVKALLTKEGKSTDPEPVYNVTDRNIPGAAGEIPARIYTPKGEGPFPVLLMIHGGGWVIATNDTYDSSNRAICNAAMCVVVSPEYRKGPENKFPAAHEDTYAVYKWLTTNAGDLKGDPKRIAVGGESAGGNMAAVISMRARDDKMQPPVHQLLVYPVASTDTTEPSYVKNMNSKPLNTPMVKWFGQHYFTSAADGKKPWISLVNAENLKDLPPATVITAEIDPLMTGGKNYADMLKKAGNDVRYRHFDGVTHEFFGMGAVLLEAKEAVKFAAEGLKSSFKK